jgi:hypothetical protein
VREKYCWLVADKPSEQGGSKSKNPAHKHFFSCFTQANLIAAYISHSSFNFTTTVRVS